MVEAPPALAAWSWRMAADLLVAPKQLSSLAQGPAAVEPLEDRIDRLAAAHRGWLSSAAQPGAAIPEALANAADRLCQLPISALEREQLRRQADAARRAAVGDTVTYVVNRNLNLSNHCVKHCGFCAFRRDPGTPGAYWLSLEELQRRAAEAQAAGASELCIQSGLNAEARLGGSSLAYAEHLLQSLLRAAPGIHLHAFSPQELLFIAEQDGIPLRQVLLRLRSAGLGSVPGTAAEVLSEAVRRQICPEKLSARAWVAVILEVHALGIASTSTMMAGHLETAADQVAHLLTLVAIQRQAQCQGQPGFSEFVLLPFVGAAAPAPLRQRVGRTQPDLAAMLTLTAQARLVLGPWIVHHQPSWVKLTLAGAGEALNWGCDDIGGTLMEEHITTMAGARGGTCQSAEALRQAAARLGRPVRERSTLYGYLDKVPC